MLSTQDCADNIRRQQREAEQPRCIGRHHSFRLGDFVKCTALVLEKPIANQMCAYESDLSRFDGSDTVVLGLSIDAQPAKAAWAQTLGPISFDLLSDFHPHGEVARKYGVFREKDGISERAVFLVDKSGTIAWARVYEIPEQPANADLFEALESTARK